MAKPLKYSTHIVPTSEVWKYTNYIYSAYPKLTKATISSVPHSKGLKYNVYISPTPKWGIYSIYVVSPLKSERTT